MFHTLAATYCARKSIFLLVLIFFAPNFCRAEEESKTVETNGGVATLSIPDHDEDRWFESLHSAHMLAESGAGFEAARVVAAIASQPDAEARHEARELLNAWELTIDEIRNGSSKDINAKIASIFHHRHDRQHDEGDARHHVHNLIRLQLLDDAAAVLRKASAGRSREEIKGRWDDLLRRLQIPVESLSAATNDSNAQLLSALRRAEERMRLREQCVSLWAIDHEAAEVARHLLRSIDPNEQEREHHEDHEPFRRWVERDEADEERDDEDSIEELSEHAHHLAFRLAKKHPHEASILAKVIIEANPKSVHAESARTLVQRNSEKPQLTTGERGGRNVKQVSDDTDLFNDTRIRDYHLALSKKAIEQLHEDPKRYVSATFREGDKVYKNVGVRIKGGWGSFRMIDGRSKAAFTIKFNEFEEDQRFHGLRRIILNNGAQDPSYLREYIGYSLFRDAGVPAPRINYASVSVNGEAYGLYIQVEAVTKDFLKRWFVDTKGNLYEGPGDVHDWEHLDLDANQEKNDRTDLRGLAEAIEQADDENPWPTLAGRLDVNAFTRFFAMEQLLTHWDGYTETNNYRIYRDPTSKKFHFFPHGCDQLFEDPRSPVFHDRGGILGRAMLQTVAGKKKYRAMMNELLEQVWHEDKIRHRIAEAYLTIHTHVANNRGKSEHSLEELERVAGRLLQFVAVRRYVVDAQLKRGESNVSWRERREHNEFPSFLYHEEDDW